MIRNLLVSLAFLATGGSTTLAQGGNFDGTWMGTNYDTGLRLRIEGQNFELVPGQGGEACGIVKGKLKEVGDSEVYGEWNAQCADLNASGLIALRLSGDEAEMSFCMSMATNSRPDGCTLGDFLQAKRTNDW